MSKTEEQLETEMQSQKTYRVLSELMSKCKTIDEMVLLITNQNLMFCGAMAFVVNKPNMTTERARALYMLRNIYTNAKNVLEGMSEAEFKEVSMKDNFQPGADDVTQ